MALWRLGEHLILLNEKTKLYLRKTTMKKIAKFYSIFTERSILVSLLLGFASALPLALSGSTLQAWFASASSVSLITVGFLSLVTLPYTIKFLWAPVMDRYVPPFLGRRRGWILICQFLLGLTIAAMALFTPAEEPHILMTLAFFVAFLSASADIAIDAYRIDILSPQEKAMGAAMAVNGYRIAMLVSGGLVLVVADYWGWRVAYLLMASLMSIGAITTFFGPEPANQIQPPRKLWDCTILPLKDFIARPQALWILVFIVMYKLGDAFAANLISPFLIRKIQMSLTEIGTLVKFSGFLGTILGTIIGGLWVPKLGWFRSLIIFGIVQTLSNLIYLPLIWTGPNYILAGSAIFLDNMFGGMGTAAFVGFVMGLCNPRFTAFQFALLSALTSIGRTFIGPVAGFVAQTFGWEIYFMSSVLFAIPGLLLLVYLRKSLEKMSSSMAEQRAALNSSPVPATG